MKISLSSCHPLSPLSSVLKDLLSLNSPENCCSCCHGPQPGDPKIWSSASQQTAGGGGGGPGSSPWRQKGQVAGGSGHLRDSPTPFSLQTDTASVLPCWLLGRPCRRILLHPVRSLGLANPEDQATPSGPSKAYGSFVGLLGVSLSLEALVQGFLIPLSAFQPLPQP